MDPKYILTTYIHDGIEGSKRNHIYEFGMDLCRIKATLEQKPYPYMLLVRGEILVKTKGKNMAKE